MQNSQTLDESTKTLIKTFPIISMKANMFKYVYLYENGGIYIDVDVEPLAPLKNWPEYPFKNLTLKFVS